MRNAMTGYLFGLNNPEENDDLKRLDDFKRLI
jgi:hypothetical protein